MQLGILSTLLILTNKSLNGRHAVMPSCHHKMAAHTAGGRKWVGLGLGLMLCVHHGACLGVLPPGGKACQLRAVRPA